MPDKYLIFVGCEQISTPVFCGIRDPKIVRIESELYRFSDSGVIDITFRECVLRNDYRSS